MLSNECDTLCKKTGVSRKKVQRKTAVQTKQRPKKKKGIRRLYSLNFRRNKSSKTQTKDSSNIK